MSPQLSISRDMFRAIIAHLQPELPKEACGILAGRKDSLAPTRFFPAYNEAQSENFYVVAPADLFRITHAIEEAGEVVWGIVHSHPATEAYPSAADIQLAYYPDSYYIIVSFLDPVRPDLRAFTIRNGYVNEVPVSIAVDH